MTLEEAISEKLEELRRNRAQLYVKIAKDAIFPCFMANYIRSGLKFQTGAFKQALSGPYAKGAIFQIDGYKLIAGIDYNIVPYAKFQIEGVSHSWVIRPKRPHKFLSFLIDGRRVYARRVVHPGLKAHDIIFMTGSSMSRVRMLAEDYFKELINDANA